MTPDLLSSLSLSTPELILAIGALALLMVGAYSRANTANTVTGLAVAVLVVAGAWTDLFHRAGQAYRRRLRPGSLRPLHEGADAGRLGGDAGDVDALCQGRRISTSSNIRC